MSTDKELALQRICNPHDKTKTWTKEEEGWWQDVISYGVETRKSDKRYWCVMCSQDLYEIYREENNKNESIKKALTNVMVISEPVVCKSCELEFKPRITRMCSRCGYPAPLTTPIIGELK